jgi:hypothetical protein
VLVDGSRIAQDDPPAARRSMADQLDEDDRSGHPFDCVELDRQLVPGDFGLIPGLHVDEEHVAEPQRTRQSQRSVNSDCPFAVRFR